MNATRPTNNQNRYLTITATPCPECGVALVVVFDPDEDRLRGVVTGEPSVHPTGPPKGFFDEYDTPAYVFCDRPGCDHQEAHEWPDIRENLPEWMNGQAKAWAEHRGVA